MFSVVEATRRATLKAVGFIQIFLGCTALFETIVAIMVKGNADKTYSSVFYILLGMVAVQCARLDIAAPSRVTLLACIILNSIVAILSFLDVALLIIGLTAFNIAGSGESYDYYESVINMMKFLVGISISKLLARVPVSITAAVLATKIKNAAVPTTDTAESAVYSAPHNGGPVITSGYSVVPVSPPSYDTATHNADASCVADVK